MPNLTEIPLAIETGDGRSLKCNASELVNLYVSLQNTGSKNKSILLHTPGSEQVLVFDYDILGIYSFLGVVYCVTKNRLYKVIPDPDEITLHNGAQITPNASLEELAEISLDKPVVFADNGIEMVFVAGNGYAYEPVGDTLKDMTLEEGWYDSDTVAYMDGYFIFNRNETGQFFISELYSTTLDPIDWATGESAPDDTVAVVVANRQLWIMGERTCEVWYDSGDPLFPFTRISGAVIDVGVINVDSVAKVLDTIIFVGSDLTVYQTNGYGLKPIGSNSVQYHITQTENTNLRGFSFQERSNWFYCLTINENKTYVYDLQTQLWHHRESDDIGRWRMNGIYANYRDGVNYGYSENVLYKMDEDLYTENGKNILREIVSLPINKTVNRVRIAELQLDMETSLGQEAFIECQLSSDGGRSYGNKRASSTGKIGETLSRVKWRRLGQHRDCVAKFTVSAPIRVKILSLHIRTA